MIQISSLIHSKVHHHLITVEAITEIVEVAVTIKTEDAMEAIEGMIEKVAEIMEVTEEGKNTLIMMIQTKMQTKIILRDS